MTEPNVTDGWTLAVIGALGVVTVITRCFFFLTDANWQTPAWLERGLQYAPIAALTAVIAPEVFLRQGQLVSTFADARLWAVVAAIAFFLIQKARDPKYTSVLGTLVAGMAVFVPLRLGLGW
jgi:branched-subunit amino acid transport protein